LLTEIPRITLANHGNSSLINGVPIAISCHQQ
jgi:hypothetical protein